MAFLLPSLDIHYKFVFYSEITCQTEMEGALNYRVSSFYNMSNDPSNQPVITVTINRIVRTQIPTSSVKAFRHLPMGRNFKGSFCYIYGQGSLRSHFVIFMGRGL